MKKVCEDAPPVKRVRRKVKKRVPKKPQFEAENTVYRLKLRRVAVPKRKFKKQVRAVLRIVPPERTRQVGIFWLKARAFLAVPLQKLLPKDAAVLKRVRVVPYLHNNPVSTRNNLTNSFPPSVGLLLASLKVASILS